MPKQGNTAKELTDILGKTCYRLSKYQTTENVKSLQDVLKQITSNINSLQKDEAAELLDKADTSLRLVVQGSDPEGPLRPLILQQQQQTEARIKRLVGQLFKGSDEANEQLSAESASDNTFKTAALIADLMVQIERKQTKPCEGAVFDFFAAINIKGIENFTMGAHNNFTDTQRRLSRRVKRIKDKLDDLQKYLLAYTEEERKNEQEAYERSFCNSVLEISISELRKCNQAAFKTISFFRPYLSKILVVDIANLLQELLREDIMRMPNEARESAIRVLDKHEPVAFEVEQTKIYSIRRELMNIEYLAPENMQTLDISFAFKSCDFVAQTVEDCRICLIWLECNIFRINTREREQITKRVMQQIQEEEHAFCRYCSGFARLVSSRCILEWVEKQALRLGLDETTLE